MAIKQRGNRVLCIDFAHMSTAACSRDSLQLLVVKNRSTETATIMPTLFAANTYLDSRRFVADWRMNAITSIAKGLIHAKSAEMPSNALWFHDTASILLIE